MNILSKLNEITQTNKNLTCFSYRIEDRDGIFPTLEGCLTAASEEEAKNELQEYYAYEQDTEPDALEITIRPCHRNCRAI
ncbi:hypothetical protein ACJGE4_20630 (plasmid) [Bacillus velezensis]|nr:MULTISPECIES: hypothetical protein [Bacillaceae]QWQ49656.1 hypothetical protein KOM03_19855 [Bacillus velezensis]QWQ49712.1 hypothetical protein KOM03_20245 [Bacillus velezensis]QYC35371.1 hypothetical protein J5X95_20305 [Bacillus amyloliquefaciens]CUB43965.1 hypothetical protein BN2127_JRS8_02717 [Bacillus amyloliquefaciens]